MTGARAKGTKGRKAPPSTRTKGRKATPRPVRKKAPPEKETGTIKALAKWTAVAAVWGLIALTAVFAWYGSGLPDAEAALNSSRGPRVTLIAADGSELFAKGDLFGMPVRLADLPPALPEAVLATEDRRFYDHYGIDPIGMARALWANMKAGRIVQGGSTITQQVAKNLFLTSERTLGRKIREVLLALWLERRFTKDQILTLYLNRVYLGAGTYGVDAAARRYFGKSARQLTLYEAAVLAGLLKAPSRYNPRAYPARSAKRTAQVLANMVAAGKITKRDAGAAKRTGATARRVRTAAKRKLKGRYFADWVMERIPSFVSPGDRDLVVVTTIDPRLQALAEEAASGAAKGPQAALVAMDTDGAVLALVGGRDYGKSQFNRAVQALRQPGSAFKPFVYLAGLEAGLGPDSRIDGGPITLEGWTPRNYDRKNPGFLTMSEALARSVNTVAVRVAERVGRDTVVRTARRLGITSELKPSPSLALGAEEVTLIDLTAAYGAFASGGFGVWPFGIREIRDGKGRVLYRREGSGAGRVIGRSDVAAMNGMLSGVIASGTGRAARLDRPAAGKTGTSQMYRDAWFIGYTADLVAGVWMGNDDGRPMKKVAGGGPPARTWARFMKAAHAGLPPRPLPGMEADPGPDPKRGFWDRLFSG